MTIRIVLADDHAVLRSGLRMLIESQDDMAVVGEASDGSEALEQTRRTLPDVLVLDLTMPGKGGLEMIATIRDSCPTTGILVLTMHDDPAYFRSALASGARGYVVKRTAGTELINAIRSVSAGRTFVDSTTAQALAADVAYTARHGRPSQPKQLLSGREREVLQLLARGFTNQESAELMRVSVKTVETYRSRLYEKLGARSRAELVRYATEAGVLKSDSTTGDSAE